MIVRLALIVVTEEREEGLEKKRGLAETPDRGEMGHDVVVALTGFARAGTIWRIVIPLELANKALDGFTDIDTFVVRLVGRSPRVGRFGPFARLAVE